MLLQHISTMYNPDHQGGLPISPRISFSNDFVLDSSASSSAAKHDRGKAAPSSSDFEFSVGSYSMMTADELFFKGRLLPLKENCTAQSQKVTLRDELRAGDRRDPAARPPKGTIRWKELLRLKKSSCPAKKHDRAAAVVLEEEEVVVVATTHDT